MIDRSEIYPERRPMAQFDIWSQVPHMVGSQDLWSRIHNDDLRLVHQKESRFAFHELGCAPFASVFATDGDTVRLTEGKT